MRAIFLTRKVWLQRNRAKIQALYPNLKTLYGPYNNSKDGRSRIVFYDGKNRSAKQFCRVKMEVKLNRILHADETVDHNDENILNDNYSNLIIRTRREHINLDVKRRKYTGYKLVCPICSTTFSVSKSQIKEQYRSIEKAGPFCSRICTGKYGASIQHGGKKLKRNKQKPIYYTNKRGL